MVIYPQFFNRHREFILIYNLITTCRYEVPNELYHKKCQKMYNTIIWRPDLYYISKQNKKIQIYNNGFHKWIF